MVEDLSVLDHAGFFLLTLVSAAGTNSNPTDQPDTAMKQLFTASHVKHY